MAKTPSILFVASLFLISSPALAAPDGFSYNNRDAGAVIRKSENKTLPSGTLEPAHNLTGIMDITSPEIESEDANIYFSADEMQNNSFG